MLTFIFVFHDDCRQTWGELTVTMHAVGLLAFLAIVSYYGLLFRQKGNRFSCSCRFS